MVLIVSTIVLSVYPKSYSKYYDKDTSALVYESTIHSKYKGKFDISLYGENSIDPSKSLSTYEQAYFTFDFERNNVIADGSLDTYTIKVPNGCSIIRAYTTISNMGNRKGNVITYNTPYSSEEENTNTIVMRCPVSQMVNSQNKIVVSVEVEETIGDKTFTYMNGTFEQSLLEYYEKHPLPVQRVEWKQTENEKYLLLPIKDTITDWATYLPENKAPLTTNNFLISGSYAWFKDQNGTESRLRSAYDIFNIVWLQNIVANSTNAYADEIVSYVTKTYPDEASIQDESIKLPGLKVIKYPTTNGYMWKYEILENFVGYARTAAVDFTKYNYMYFSTSDSDALDKAFNEYLEMYPYQGVDIEEIKKQINLLDPNGGISYILNNKDGNVEIKANGNIYVDGKLFENLKYYPSDNRLELVNNRVIHIPFSDEDSMKATFRSELSRIYVDELKELSTSSRDKIVNAEDVINSLVKNSTLNSTKESYSEYFIVQDGDKYLLVNVYSTGIDETYVTVSTLDAELENNALQFRFSSEDNNELLGIVNALDEHFIDHKIHTSLPSFDDYISVTKSGDVTNVVYTIPNRQAYASFDDDTTTEEMRNEYNNLLQGFIHDGIVSQETIDYILSDDVIYNSSIPADIKPGFYMLWPAMRDSAGNRNYKPGTSYNFYFVVAGKGNVDKDKYLLFNVYTGGYDKVSVTISELASKEENGTVRFDLQNDNRYKLTKIVRGLDYYFTGKYLHTSVISTTTISVEYPITSTTSIDDSVQIEEMIEVSASLQTSNMNEEYLEIKEVSDENTIEEKESTSVLEEEDENKKYSDTQENETNNTTEETEETSNDDSYVPSNDASNRDAEPSSNGEVDATSSIVNEVVEVNSSSTGEIPLIETGE